MKPVVAELTLLRQLLNSEKEAYQEASRDQEFNNLEKIHLKIEYLESMINLCMQDILN